MPTTKPVSSISYNTLPFFKSVLDDLYKRHVIQSYFWISHKGEDGDKDHIHFRIVPNRRIDVMDIKALFIEKDPSHVKPLGVLGFRPSKEEDWLLYAVHDEDYLKSKYGAFERGEKLPYAWTDIRHEGDTDIETVFLRAKQSLRHSNAALINRLKSGELPLQLVREGESPHTVKFLLDLALREDIRWYEEASEMYRKRLVSLVDFLREEHGIIVSFDDENKPILNFSLKDYIENAQ